MLWIDTQAPLFFRTDGILSRRGIVRFGCPQQGPVLNRVLLAGIPTIHMTEPGDPHCLGPAREAVLTVRGRWFCLCRNQRMPDKYLPVFVIAFAEPVE